MAKLNVVNFGDFKEHRELKRHEDAYKLYLSTLGHSQLEGEVNHLLEEFALNTYGKDYFAKGELILKEISARAHGPAKSQIEALSLKKGTLS